MISSIRFLTYLSVLVALLPCITTSQWTWQNPRPHGKGIENIYFLDDEHGVSVGEGWNYIATSDGGNTWTVVSDPSQTGDWDTWPYNERLGLYTIFSAQFFGSDTALVIAGSSYRPGLMCWGPVVLVKTTDGGRTWPEVPHLVARPPYPEDYPIAVFDFSFADVLHGAAYSFVGGCDIGADEFLSTTSDGGKTWNAIFGSIHNVVGKFIFLDSSTIIIENWDGLFGEHRLLKTTDAGASWQDRHGLGGYWLRTLTRTGEAGLLGTGIGGVIVRSTDLGDTWTQVNIGANLDLKKVSVLDSSSIVVLGRDDSGASHLFLSEDGGVLWTDIYTSYFPWNGISWKPNGELWLGGEGGTMLKSTDRGGIWTLTGTRTTTHLKTVSFISKQIGWIAGDSGYIAKTTDFGSTWQKLDSPTHASIIRCTFSSEDDGWILDSEGSIMRTSSGGITWQEVYQSSKDTVRALASLGGQYAIATGDSCLVLRTSDGGETWSTVNVGLRPGAVCGDVTMGSDGTAFAAFDSILYFSSDTGKSWTDARTVPFFASVGRINRMIRPSKNVIYVFASNADFSSQINYRSTNEGVTWAPIRYPRFAASSTRDFEFYSDSVGWAIGKALWKTTDAGKTWTEDLRYQGNDLFLFADGEGWIVGDYGGLIRTDIYTDVKEDPPAAPREVRLFQNYPNPFNPETAIRYSLPGGGRVTLNVYDLLGREVATLVNEQQPAGEYTRTWDARGRSSGLYICRLTVSGTHSTSVQMKKMVLMR
jgi:photosystem II stability/assembly factor-like uncharacterized protein